ncbi:igLON family member 5 isoform X4 [Meriones unguiculatus]|uniref:igLON family member 5 isoform X4 n=1 Tax=Meriones unguiculatus TaxID=10047 RepID=UPI00293F12F6|nr:igLON family member 5 isoform X4 [Meriones unguiculatus]
MSWHGPFSCCLQHFESTVSTRERHLVRCCRRLGRRPGLLSQSLEFSSPADNYTVCEGDNATLSCFIDEHVTRVAWLNRSNILYAGNDRWTSDPRVRLLINTPEEFSILITQVGLGDEGLYTCSFQTRHQPFTTQVFLIVHVPARIVNISSPVAVNEGGNVNLLCLAVGRPEPTVTWRQLRVFVSGPAPFPTSHHRRLHFRGRDPGNLRHPAGSGRGIRMRYSQRGELGAGQPPRAGHSELSPDHHRRDQRAHRPGPGCSPPLRSHGGAACRFPVVQG